MELRVRVNGEAVVSDAAPNLLLIDLLRDEVGLTSVKRSCDVQVCGACTVLLDGRPVSSCCTLAWEARDRGVTSVEGLAADPRFAELERAFTEHAAVQCGFCTPGLVLTVRWLLDEGMLTSETAVREQLAGNLCRCTGYKGILEAVCDLAGVAAP
jgi:aerobic-type carbon monoxide dehydrogenase small subunit (CoxS/CutS family)